MNAQLKPEPITGFFENERAEHYHVKTLGEISNSGIKRLLRSPMHYKAWVEDVEPMNDTPAMLFGRAFHAAILEPELFASDYAVEPEFGDCRFKENKARRDDWRLANSDKIPLGADDNARIKAMLESVNAHPWARRAIRDGQSELTLRWVDEDTGLHCKARADRFVDGAAPFVLDVKTCEDASPAEFARAVAKYGYHIQHAHYCDGFRALGKPLTNYLLLAVEHTAPYAVALYYIDAAAEARGYELRARAMASAAECMQSGIWHAYSNDISPLTLPAWSLKD